MSFVNEIGAIFQDMLLTTDPTQAGALGAVAIVAGFVMLVPMAEAFGFKFMTPIRALAFYVPFVIISLALVAAVRLYVPQIPEGAASIAAQVAVPIVVALALLPILSILAKGNYMQAVAKLAIAVLFAAIITAMVKAGWNSVAHGREQMAASESRTDAMDEAVGDAME